VPDRLRPDPPRRRSAAQPRPERRRGRGLRRPGPGFLMADEEVIVIERKPLARRVLRWLAIALLGLTLLLVAAVAWLNTSSGRQFIVGRIARVAPASGLTVEVGRIDGSPL